MKDNEKLWSMRVRTCMCVCLVTGTLYAKVHIDSEECLGVLFVDMLGKMWQYLFYCS